MTTIGTVSVGANAAPATKNAYSTLGSDDFLKIIMTELGNQDPLSPSDSKALLEQLSSIRNIQASVDMQDALKSLVAQNELASAAGLVGRTVTGTSGGQTVTGRVTGVNRTNGGVELTLSTGESLRMSNFRSVAEPTGTGTATPMGASNTPTPMGNSTGTTP